MHTVSLAQAQAWYESLFEKSLSKAKEMPAALVQICDREPKQGSVLGRVRLGA